MIYIQRKDSDGNLETVDQFEDWREAVATVKNYRVSDRSAWYYVSSRACNAWRISSLVEEGNDVV